MRALAVVALALGLSSLASAAPRRWAIGEIRVEGDVDEAARAAVEERTWRALSLALPTEALLAPHDAVAGALAATPALRGCAEDRCSLALGDRLAVERLITVRIERRGDGWTAHLLSFAVDAAQVAGTLELPCPGCSADALMDNFARAAAPLLRDERDRSLCTLTVVAPAGAPVSVDTVALGEAPFAHTVAAGRHTVAAAGAQAEIDCGAGAARTVKLGATAGVESTRRTLELGLGATSAVLAAGSLAGLVTAGTFDDRAACAGRCGYRYDTTIGIALGAVGVTVFTAAAVALLVTSRKPPARSVARATTDRAASEAAASSSTRAAAISSWSRESGVASLSAPEAGASLLSREAGVASLSVYEAASLLSREAGVASLPSREAGASLLAPEAGVASQSAHEAAVAQSSRLGFDARDPAWQAATAGQRSPLAQLAGRDFTPQPAAAIAPAASAVTLVGSF